MKKKFALILIAITSFLATSTLKSTQNFQTTLAMEDYDPKDENRQFTPQPPANYSDLHKKEYEEGDTPLGLPKQEQDQIKISGYYSKGYKTKLIEIMQEIKAIKDNINFHCESCNSFINRINSNLKNNIKLDETEYQVYLDFLKKRTILNIDKLKNFGIDTRDILSNFENIIKLIQKQDFKELSHNSKNIINNFNIVKNQLDKIEIEKTANKFIKNNNIPIPYDYDEAPTLIKKNDNNNNLNVINIENNANKNNNIIENSNNNNMAELDAPIPKAVDKVTSECLKRLYGKIKEMKVKVNSINTTLTKLNKTNLNKNNIYTANHINELLISCKDYTKDIDIIFNDLKKTTISKRIFQNLKNKIFDIQYTILDYEEKNKENIKDFSILLSQINTLLNELSKIDKNIADVQDDVNKKAFYNLYENLETKILSDINKIKSDLELFDNKKISTKTITRQTIENLSNMVKAYETTLKNPLIKNNEKIRSNLNCFIERTKSTIDFFLDDENKINKFYENKLKKLSETNEKNLENKFRDCFKESRYYALKKALEAYESAIIMSKALFD